MQMPAASNREQMAGAVGRAAPPLVINLRGRHVFMAEQFLHLADIDAAVKQ